MADPVSWLQIAQGWNVVTSDGISVGVVAQVEGDKQEDIFDGLAVESKQPARILYVPGEQVGAIFPGEVTLKIAAADAGTLEPFQAPPPETKWAPGKAPLATRMSNWLRGKPYRRVAQMAQCRAIRAAARRRLRARSDIPERLAHTTVLVLVLHRGR